jgi:hypothetical protein
MEMSFAKLQLGDVVLSGDGSDLGSVAEISETCFRVTMKRKKDQWLPGDAILNRESGIALLRYPKDSLAEAMIDTEQHRGLHSHKPPKSEGGGLGGLVTPVLMLGGAAALFLRNKERREQVKSTAQKTAKEVKARASRGSKEASLPGGENYGATGTLSSEGSRPDAATSSQTSGMPSASETPPAPPHITEEDLPVSRRREEAITGMVTAAFPAMNLRVAPVAVRALEGGDDNPTLRFTLDDTYSSDLGSDELSDTSLSDERLANKVVEDLRKQVPPGQRAG